MAHAHRHFGAEKIVTAETPRLRVDMNLTPLIDVLLVLLVIFLTVLPLTQQALDTKLPSQTTERGKTPPGTPIVLEYAADGRMAVNKQDVTVPELEGRLRAIFSDRADKTMYIAAAGSLRYKRVIDAIDAAKGAGVDRVGIITEAMRAYAPAR